MHELISQLGLLPVQRRGVWGGRLGVPVFFDIWLNERFSSGLCPFFSTVSSSVPGNVPKIWVETILVLILN
jgi:hypothetical protein